MPRDQLEWIRSLDRYRRYLTIIAKMYTGGPWGWTSPPAFPNRPRRDLFGLPDQSAWRRTARGRCLNGALMHLD